MRSRLIKVRANPDDDTVILQILEKYLTMLEESMKMIKPSERDKLEKELIEDTLKRNNYSS